VNPEGIQSSSPGLAFFSQPWEQQNQEIQPRRGCVSDRSSNIQTDTTLFRVANLISLFPQGWLKNANPGLEDEIPSGFMPISAAQLA
jgi:hypothetical protein